MRFLWLFLCITPSFAQVKPPVSQAVTQFADWAVFISTTAKGKVCYAASPPKTRLPKDLKRDPAFIMISTRPAEKIINEISIQNGFASKIDVDAVLTIGAASYPLFTKGEGAWVKLPADEPKLLVNLKTAATFTVKSTSLKGNALTDSYSLSGLSQALEKVAQECK
jgi:invasion protein IalB